MFTTELDGAWECRHGGWTCDVLEIKWYKTWLEVSQKGETKNIVEMSVVYEKEIRSLRDEIENLKHS